MYKTKERQKDLLNYDKYPLFFFFTKAKYEQSSKNKIPKRNERRHDYLFSSLSNYKIRFLSNFSEIQKHQYIILRTSELIIRK